MKSIERKEFMFLMTMFLLDKNYVEEYKVTVYSVYELIVV